MVVLRKFALFTASLFFSFFPFLFLVFLLGCSHKIGENIKIVPSQNHKSNPVQILAQTQIFSYPNQNPYDRANLFGFNHAPSIIHMPNGKLCVAWFSGPFEAALSQLILISCSSDQGINWSSPKIVHESNYTSSWDPAFIQADGSRVFLFFSEGRWVNWPSVQEPNKKVGRDSFRLFSQYTDDSGESWSSPTPILDKYDSRNNGIRLSSQGDLLLPLHNLLSTEVALIRSSDQGKSWKLSQKIDASFFPGNFPKIDEPAIAELISGQILMALRTDDGHLWTVSSPDGGNTWRQPEKTDLPASSASPALFRTKQGKLLLIYNDTPPRRTQLSLRVSEDEGKTWCNPLTLATAPSSAASSSNPQGGASVWSEQVTYPSITEDAAGNIYVVWVEIILGDLTQSGKIQFAKLRLE